MQRRSVTIQMPRGPDVYVPQRSESIYPPSDETPVDPLLRVLFAIEDHEVSNTALRYVVVYQAKGRHQRVVQRRRQQPDRRCAKDAKPTKSRT